MLLQQQIQQKQNFQQQPQQPQQRIPQQMQPSPQQYQQMHHHQKANPDNQSRHVTPQQNMQQPSPQSMLQQQQMQSPQQAMQSPQQQMQSPHPQMQQYHPQVRQQIPQQMQTQSSQHMHSMQQHSHAGGAGGNFTQKMPASTVIASGYNNTNEYVNSAVNPYPGAASACRSMQMNQVNRLAGNYNENIMNSGYQQHNFIPSTSQNATHVIHQNVPGSSKSQTFNASEANSNSGNYGYPNVMQNPAMGMAQSPMLASMPTPTPTPSPTPTQSPTRYMQRASVITTENNQPNGMYSLPVVDKFLMGNDINLNMSDQSMVPDLNSSVLLQQNMVEQLPSIIDPSTNQPIHIPPQLQSHIESHLQLNGQPPLTSQMGSHEMYPADMLESTINSCGTDGILSSNVQMISGDLSMTPPLSSSVPQLDSVPNIQSKSILR